MVHLVFTKARLTNMDSNVKSTPVPFQNLMINIRYLDDYNHFKEFFVFLVLPQFNSELIGK